MGRRATLVALCIASCHPAALTSAQEHASMPSHHANGTFTVTMRAPAPAPTSEFVRLTLDKQFHGGLEGTSVVEMLASNAGDKPSGGYVALERFTGTLEGRTGSFVMQHSGTMSPAGAQIAVQVSPGSGTGDLAGIEGRLTIRIDGKQHFYELQYELPQ